MKNKKLKRYIRRAKRVRLCIIIFLVLLTTASVITTVKQYKRTLELEQDLWQIVDDYADFKEWQHRR
jgi:hypothetical protein